MEKRRIAIMGTGYVGLVSGACLAEVGHQVVCVDIVAEKVEMLRRGKIPIYEPGLDEIVHRCAASGRLSFTTSIPEAVAASEILFICVPTPPRDDGSADLSFVEASARQVAESLRPGKDGYRLVVEKSTVPVETCERVAATLRRHAPAGAEFDVASNPEFLREGQAVGDFLRPDRIVVGVESPRAEALVRSLYAPFTEKGAPLLLTDVKSAEIIKHASNSFLATKISFTNDVARLCEAVGADIGKVAEGMGLDKRIGRAFLNAGIGYGGSCFPKDVQAFHWIAKKHGVDIKLLEAVQETNREMRRALLRKIHDALWVVKGKRIAVWGLAFKPETDDVREAPALEIIPALAAEGAMVAAYDPQAAEKARPHLPAGVEIAASAEAAARGADALVLTTEWDEFRAWTPERLAGTLAHKVVVDGRNVFDPAAMRAAGFTYLSVGRSPVGG